MFGQEQKRTQRRLDDAFHANGLPGEPPQAEDTLWARSKLPPELYLTMLGYPATYKPAEPTREARRYGTTAGPVKLSDPFADGDYEPLEVLTVAAIPLGPGVADVVRRLRDEAPATRARLAGDASVADAAERVLRGSFPKAVSEDDVRATYYDGYAAGLADRGSDAPSAPSEVAGRWWQVLACLALPRHPSLPPTLYSGYYHARTGSPAAYVTEM